ncbi:LTA synthase family protein [uncultured Limosilactobacillus sp.]|uniref:LTA synthase family protein n=1 Tax=uncultured Limosilactobacillus sp. TaxID=2837629 RepID=UPI0025FDA715|nr:LTA synthase family protein [uncultured Limosilactobacillus sp.]
MKRRKLLPIYYCELILLILNSWLWNTQLPLVNYAMNDGKMMLIQVIHVILNVGMITVLLRLGRSFIQQRVSIKILLNSWLLVIILGIGELIIQLLWKNEFQFPDLVNSLFPLSRNVIPVVMGIILSRNLVPYFKLLKKRSQIKIGLILLGGLFSTTLFNANLWGFNGAYNLGLTLIFVSMGALFSEFQLPITQRKLKIAIGGVLLLDLVLAAVMPKISVSIHNDFSTAMRFANPTNVLTVIIALGFYYLMRYRFTSQMADLAAVAVALATYPTLMNLFISSIMGHFNQSMIRYTVILMCSVILLPISYCCLRFLRLVAKSSVYLQCRLQIDNLNNFSDVKQLLANHWKRFGHEYLAVGFLYLLSLVSLLAMDNSLKLTPNVNYTYNTFIYTFCNKQSVIILTTLLIWLMFKFCQSLTNSFWWGIGITTTINVIWVIANRIKIGARNEPIMPSEMMMYQAYGSILKMVNPWLLFGALVVIVLIGFVIWWLNKNVQFAKLSAKARIVYVILALLAYSSAIFWNHQGSPIQTFVQGMGFESYPFNQLSGARVNGPLVQFMSNIDVKVMDKPAGYSKKTMQNIAKKYRLTAQHINQSRQNNLSKQTIILNLSESFANPNRVPGVHLKHNPMPYITSLKKQTTSGLMVSSGYGGGTANMEYMSLTGLTLANFTPTLATPFTQLVPFAKQAWSINRLFKDSTAIHPYVGSFYSRPTVYRKFGFDRFMYLGSRYKIRHQKKIDRSPYLSDETSYENVEEQLKRHQSSQFISIVTMQNHFPYTEHFYDGAKKYQATIHGSETDSDTVAQYAMGVHYTDQAVKQFIKQINREQRPITVIFYGDHLPGIYKNDMNRDGLKLHETDYFIYSNLAARQRGAKQFISHAKIVSPNDFIAMLAEQTNSKVTPYIALLTRVYQDLPAVSLKTNNADTNGYHSAPQFTNEQGKVVSKEHFTKAQKELWHDYLLVQYDMTAGHHYLGNNFLK